MSENREIEGAPNIFPNTKAIVDRSAKWALAPVRLNLNNEINEYTLILITFPIKLSFELQFKPCSGAGWSIKNAEIMMGKAVRHQTKAIEQKIININGFVFP